MATESSTDFLSNFSASERKTLEDALRQMKEARENYKRIINEYYIRKTQQGKLFPEGRELCRASFDEDITQYDELVEHCLRAGDADILYNWGINFLKTSGGTSRLGSGNFENYRDAFEELIQDSKHPLEKICMTILRDTFQELL